METKRHPSEVEIVTMFRARCKIQCPAVHVVAIPNGSRRTQWQINQAMREGLAIGFPDVMCLAPCFIAFIEFKTRAGKLSRAQEEWLDRLNFMGFPASVARSADDGLAFLRAVGAPFIGRITA